MQAPESDNVLVITLELEYSGDGGITYGPFRALEHPMRAIHARLLSERRGNLSAKTAQVTLQSQGIVGFENHVILIRADGSIRVRELLRPLIDLRLLP